jgi:hypothetical protein
MTPPLRPKLMEAVDRALAGDWERAHLIVQDHEGDPSPTGSTPSYIGWRAIWETPVSGTAAVATRRARRSRRRTSSGKSARRWSADEGQSLSLVH